ncbi:hypothetical protein A4X13_0g5748 [Tilletia indica]|uniref:Uncharacterized protein n=1 Tax=Tilletia indica TaxID=43049 RepID=A0A8T8SRM1_9BASI|nr:hypothetical protein A4X13_0g5748 [Tilletia indica]
MPFGDLPCEILHMIGRHVMDDTKQAVPDENKPNAFLNAVRNVQAVSAIGRDMSCIMREYTQKRFDGIPTWRHYSARAHLTQWIPSHGRHQVESQVYWYGHLGHEWPETSEIRPQIKWFDQSGASKAEWIRADLRVRGANLNNPVRDWQEDMWNAGLEFIWRIPVPNPSLKVLHLLFSARQDVVAAISNILREIPQLTDIVLISDSVTELPGLARPTLNLDEIYSTSQGGEHLERFLIRAPSIRVKTKDPAKFFSNLRKSHTVCLAVHRLEASIRVREWVLDLLNAASAIRACEISEASPYESIQARNSAPLQNKYVQVDCVNLMHLTLDLFYLDAIFFAHLEAPCLKYLRIRVPMRLGRLGFCDFNHFPSLLVAHIWCPGPPMERFRAVGLGQSQYLHNRHDWYAAATYNEDILVYIKPFDPESESFYEDFPPASDDDDDSDDIDSVSSGPEDVAGSISYEPSDVNEDDASEEEIEMETDSDSLSTLTDLDSEEEESGMPNDVDEELCDHEGPCDHDDLGGDDDDIDSDSIDVDPSTIDNFNTVLPGEVYPEWLLEAYAQMREETAAQVATSDDVDDEEEHEQVDLGFADVYQPQDEDDALAYAEAAFAMGSGESSEQTLEQLYRSINAVRRGSPRMMELGAGESSADNDGDSTMDTLF